MNWGANFATDSTRLTYAWSEKDLWNCCRLNLLDLEDLVHVLRLDYGSTSTTLTNYLISYCETLKLIPAVQLWFLTNTTNGWGDLVRTFIWEYILKLLPLFYKTRIALLTTAIISTTSESKIPSKFWSKVCSGRYSLASNWVNRIKRGTDILYRTVEQFNKSVARRSRKKDWQEVPILFRESMQILWEENNWTDSMKRYLNTNKDCGNVEIEFGLW